MEKTLWKHIQSVKNQSPLVHNITNYVVMNNTANAFTMASRMEFDFWDAAYNLNVWK